ncbi:hypothetical protein B0H67DRAFT_140387 [Lasiosphaeris hirsuta]|uniref:Uncharacterized protein n=1 Tax=Lasiosphaeris hirsuta TaxID=260670 RepID=A0AA40B151_9PEZI|nr:hypothetical protein B0H67DRAFT_140387 [Lasiosphaeris hirsuta]
MPKRKHDSEPDMPGRRGGRVPQTPEIQELYNKMRRIEERLTFRDALELQNGQGGNDSHLRPPETPSQATSMSRTHSHVSTTRSITRDLDEADIDEQQSPAPKKRAIRKGHLSPFKKARAAFMRKIGACPECRARKVPCIHYDKPVWEPGYQNWKRIAQANGSISPGPQSAQEPQFAPVVRQPSFRDIDVGAVGDWVNQPSVQVPVSGNPQQDPAGAELDAIALETRPPAAPTAPLYQFPGVRPSPAAFPQLWARPPPPNNPEMFGPDPIAIGRLLGGAQVWECKFGDNTSSPGFPYFEVCNRHYGSLRELQSHYAQDHGPLCHPFTMWKCIAMRPQSSSSNELCGLMNPDATSPCVQCQCGGDQRERWCLDTIPRTPSLTSGTSNQIPSQDGSIMDQYRSFNYFPSLGQQDMSFLFPGRFTHGSGYNGGGSYHSFKDKPGGAAWKNSLRSRLTDTHSGPCPHDGKCASEPRLMKGLVATCIALKTHPFWSALATLPLLLIFSVGSMLVLENWLVTGASIIKSKELASTVSSMARTHVMTVSVVCIITGFLMMWLFKHVWLRLGRGSENSVCGPGLTNLCSSASSLALCVICLSCRSHWTLRMRALSIGVMVTTLQEGWWVGGCKF